MYKRIANSVYGIGMPSRCNGKQMFCDITTGKKILIDKEKYDDLMECVNNISLTYEMMKLTPFSMDRPLWLSGIINRIEDLTK
jgi:lipoate synthase